MSAHVVKITGPAEDGRYDVACSCGWRQDVAAVVTAAVVWGQHAKEASA